MDKKIAQEEISDHAVVSKQPSNTGKPEDMGNVEASRLSGIIEQQTGELTWAEKFRILRETLNWPGRHIMEYIDTGYKQQAFIQYCTVEQKYNKPTDYLVDAICRSYYVNPKWMYNGEGEILFDARRIKSREEEIRARAGRKKVSRSLKGLINLAETMGVGLEWLLCGDEDAKDNPVNEKMVSYLQRNEDARREIWERMNIGTNVPYAELKTIKAENPLSRIKAMYKVLGVKQSEFGAAAGVSMTHITTLSDIQIAKIGLTWNVSRDWIRNGNTASLAFPCDQKMIIWLREHPEVRQEIRRSMNAGAVIR